MMIDALLRVTPAGKDQLVTLKRRTGLVHWNELCRWAFCRSLAEQGAPSRVSSENSSVEVEWRTLTGSFGGLFEDLLTQRALQEGLEPAECLRRHVHRGIGYLVGETQSGADLFLLSSSWQEGPT
jgi:DNA sulfur modification protein DndE